MSLRKFVRAATALVLPSTTLASYVYVTSYSGTLTTLDFTAPGTVKSVTTSRGCGAQPSWLTLDYSRRVLYCLNEAFDSGDGTVTAFNTTSSGNGTLVPLDTIQVPGGPVSAVLFPNIRQGLAVASYSASAVSVYDVALPNYLAESWAQYFYFNKPGPVPDRQDAPHPHQVILDPTQKYVVAPDLGADQLRVWYVTNMTEPELRPAPFINVAPGSGPRHGAFLVLGGTTYFYLISELANTISTYKVTYGTNALNFTLVTSMNTHGPNGTVVSGTKAAEITISPDKKFLIASSRGENSFNISNFNTGNTTQVLSDPLITYSIDQTTGALSLVQVYPAGGTVPRHFSLNKNGTLAGVGLQGDGRVVFLNRDVATGKFTGIAGSIAVAGEITCVVFNE